MLFDLKSTSADVLSGERLELLDGGLLLVPDLGPESVALDLCSRQLWLPFGVTHAPKRR